MIDLLKVLLYINSSFHVCTVFSAYLVLNLLIGVDVAITMWHLKVIDRIFEIRHDMHDFYRLGKLHVIKTIFANCRPISNYNIISALICHVDVDTY